MCACPLPQHCVWALGAPTTAMFFALRWAVRPTAPAEDVQLTLLALRATALSSLTCYVMACACHSLLRHCLPSLLPACQPSFAPNM